MVRSSRYCAAPVTFARPSLRTTEWPTARSLMSRAPSEASSLLAHRVADLLDAERAHVEERDDAARARLASLELPREGADDAALIERLLDVAAHILGVDAAFGEGEVVHGEDLFLHEASALVMAVLVLAEVLEHRLAHLLLEAVREVGPHVADGRVHRMVAGAGVDAPP